jgi:hypothetical protein
MSQTLLYYLVLNSPEDIRPQDERMPSYIDGPVRLTLLHSISRVSCRSMLVRQEGAWSDSGIARATPI